MTEYFKIRKCEDGVIIEGYTGSENCLHIPSLLEGMTVIGIDKKAFYGNRFLHAVTLPGGLQQIGDWAFAGCQNLQQVHIAGMPERFGRRIFSKCPNLTYLQIVISDEQSVDPYFLAILPMLTEAEYLFDEKMLGSRSWFQLLDRKLEDEIFHTITSDLDGLVYSAEEDIEEKVLIAMREKKRKKAQFMLRRLLEPKYLDKDLESCIRKEILEHTVGTVDPYVFLELKVNGPLQLPFCDILIEIGALCWENLSAAMESLQEEHAELKAYLLRKLENESGKDPFSSWDL